MQLTLKAMAALLMLFGASARASEAPSCGELPCRANGLPYVTASGTVIILPGESFAVELKIEGDKIVAIVPRKAPDVASTITLELSVKNGMTGLIWGNKLDRPVRFDATSTAPSRQTNRLECPLPQNKYTYHVWQFVPEAVEIGNFSFTPVDGAKCD